MNFPHCSDACTNLLVAEAVCALQLPLSFGRLGKGACSSQLQLYLCPAVSPLSVCSPLLSQKSTLSSQAAQFVKITHSDWCHFEWGLVSAFRGMITPRQMKRQNADDP